MTSLAGVAACGGAPSAEPAPSMPTTSVVAAPTASTAPAVTAAPTASAAPAAPAHPTPHDVLLVIAKRERSLAIVDPTTLEVLNQIPVGPDPHEVIASADGHFAYISNYGSGAFNTLAVVDLDGQTAGTPVDLGALRGPHGLTTNGGKIWFTAEAAKAIGSYDPAAQKVDWLFGTGQNRTHMLVVAPDGKRIVTSNVASGTVSIIEKSVGGPGRGGPGMGPPPGGGPGGPGMGPPPDGGGPHGPPGGDWEQTVVPAGRGAEGFDVSPDGKEIWAANAQDATITVIDASTKKVTQTLKNDMPRMNRLKFTLDGTRVVVAGGPSVLVYDARTKQVVKRIPVGKGSAGIVMQPDGARAFVACSPDDYVAVIDLKTLAMSGKVATGHEPDGVAWAVRTR